MATVYEQIMELEAQKQKLLDTAKRDLLKQAEKAIADLNNLGFNYRLVEGAAPATRTTGGRRSTVSQDVYNTIKNAPEGMTRAGVLEAMSAEDDKAKQSVSNALANLKKKGKLVLSDDGTYTAQ